MANIFNIENLAMIRKYPTELIVLGLITWCTYLQFEVAYINKVKEKYLLDDREKMLNAITENTRVIEQNNILFQTILSNDFQQNNIPRQPGKYTGKGEPKNGRTSN